MCLLYSADLQSIEDHLNKILCVPRICIREPCCLNEFLVFIHGENPMRRETLDGERAGDADLLVVLIGLIVEVLELSFGGN